MIPLFDLHCDTLTELFNRKSTLSDNDLHISSEKMSKYSPFIQILSIWSDKRQSDEDAYLRFLEVCEYAGQLKLNVINSSKKIRQNSFFLSVEDARILNNDLSRVEVLYKNNIRFLIMMWQGKTCIGGSWDTDFSLSSFGINVVLKCFDFGIIPDISHSSFETANDILSLGEKYNKPIIASHSDSYTVCNNRRNMNDGQFKRIKDLGGVVGISFAPSHLSENGKASLDDILKHIEHYLLLDGENTVCFGCDFDGVSSLPFGITGIESMSDVYRSVYNEFGREICLKLFFENPYNFAVKNLK